MGSPAYTFLLCLIVLIKLGSRVECGQVCSQLPKVKHARIIDCEFVDGDEKVNAECELGYEFETNVVRKQYDLYDSLFYPIECTGK
jgi:hypothetical protein